MTSFFTNPYEDCQKAIEKPLGPNTLSPLKPFGASKTSLSEKRLLQRRPFNNLQPCKRHTTNTGPPPFCSRQQKLKLIHQIPLILTRAIELLLLCALAILWKNLVFLSPYFSHSSLDFCLQEISSRRTHFLKSSFISLLASNSWTTSGRAASTLSQNST